MTRLIVAPTPPAMMPATKALLPFMSIWAAAARMPVAAMFARYPMAPVFDVESTSCGNCVAPTPPTTAPAPRLEPVLYDCPARITAAPMPRVHATATMPPGGASGVFPPAIILTSSRSCHTFASFRRWIYQGEDFARIRSAPVLPAHRSCCTLAPLLGRCVPSADDATLGAVGPHEFSMPVGFGTRAMFRRIPFAFALARQRSFRRGPHAFSAKRRFLFQALLSRHVSPLSRRIGDSYFPDSHGHRSPPIGWPSRAAV